MRNGVPKSKSSHINNEYSDEALLALTGLPQSWRDFVNACDISETDTKIQSAIWELVATEVDYIHAIQTVTDVSLFNIFYFPSAYLKNKNPIRDLFIDLQWCSHPFTFQKLSWRVKDNEAKLKNIFKCHEVETFDKDSILMFEDLCRMLRKSENLLKRNVTKKKS